MRAEFIKSIEKNQANFDLKISDEKISVLADFYEFVIENNEFLHLVAPSTPETFAVRHVLESIYATNYLPNNAKFADIGTGAGLPAIPCLIYRDDLKGILIESKIKKADFLTQALSKLKFDKRTKLVNRQFGEIDTADFSVVLCRALDKFANKLPKILKWANNSNFIFFGGNNLSEALENSSISFEKILIPLSEQRFIFISKSSK